MLLIVGTSERAKSLNLFGCLLFRLNVPSLKILANVISHNVHTISMFIVNNNILLILSSSRYVAGHRPIR